MKPIFAFVAATALSGEDPLRPPGPRLDSGGSQSPMQRRQPFLGAGSAGRVRPLTGELVALGSNSGISTLEPHAVGKWLHLCEPQSPV